MTSNRGLKARERGVRGGSLGKTRRAGDVRNGRRISLFFSLSVSLAHTHSLELSILARFRFPARFDCRSRPPLPQFRILPTSTITIEHRPPHAAPNSRERRISNDFVEKRTKFGIAEPNTAPDPPEKNSALNFFEQLFFHLLEISQNHVSDFFANFSKKYLALLVTHPSYSFL